MGGRHAARGYAALVHGDAKSFATSDGLEIVYEEWGAGNPGPPVVLQHGFVVDADVNWVLPGIVDALVAAGRRVIAPDARGHGRSSKAHDPSFYGEHRMARDLGELLDIVGASEVDLVGYSMGAVVVLLVASGGARVRRLVIGGVGAGVVECGGVDRRAISNESIIEALSVDDPSTIVDPGAAAFRSLAGAVGADRDALVAQARSVYRGDIPLERITAPTLLLAGEEDPLAVRPEVLSAAIGDATLEMVGGDHAGAVAEERFTRAIVEFLA